MTDSTFNFDEWLELAQKNPEKFERRRTEEIEKIIKSSPPETKKRLERLQWKVNEERRKLKNPLSSAAVIAVFEILEKENLVEKCNQVGACMMRGLIELKEKYEILGDVRGKGLVIGLEFVEEGKKPAPEFTNKVVRAAAERGLMLGKLGLYGNVIRVAPPLVITKEEADLCVEILDSAIGSVLER